MTEISAPSEIGRLDFDVPENKEYLLDLFTKWSTSIDKSKVLLLDDYLFKDPLVEAMKPSSAYVYTLGLELALGYSIDSLNKIVEQTTQQNEIPLEDFPLNIKNKIEFLQNLSQYKRIVKNRTPPLKLHKCQYCDFTAETLIILDQHLTQPHFYSTVFRCNFCDQFRSNSKEEYRAHLFNEHTRISNLEKPLVQCMCSKCNFECGNDVEKLVKHENFMCPFRSTEKFANPLLDNLQAPTKVDLLEFEFLFNEKPIDNIHCDQAHLNMTSEIAQPVFSWTKQSKLTELMIMEEKMSDPPLKIPTILSVTKPGSKTVNNLVKFMSIPTTAPSATPNKDLIISINTTNHYKCHICDTRFLGEYKIKSLIDHLRVIHQIEDKTVLSKCIQQYVLPQMNKSTINIQPNDPMLISLLAENNTNENSIKRSLSVMPATPKCLKIKPIILTPTQTTQTSQSENSIFNGQTENSILRPPIFNSKPTVIKILNNFNFKHENTTLNFNKEKELIVEILNKSILRKVCSNEVLVDKLNELKIISGRCFKCDFFKIEPNLLVHLKELHNLSVEQLVIDLNCLFCGIRFPNRDQLVVHQLSMHKSISFTSTNKLYTIPLHLNSDSIPEINILNQFRMDTKLGQNAQEKQTRKHINILPKIRECFPIPKSPPITLININNSFNSDPNNLTSTQATNQDDCDNDIIWEDSPETKLNVQHGIMIQKLETLTKKRKLNTESDEQKCDSKKKITTKSNCSKCSKVFRDADEFTNHLKNSHSDSMQLIEPLNVVQKSEPIFNEKCFFCPEEFNLKLSYQEHLKSKHMKIAILKLNKIDPAIIQTKNATSTDDADLQEKAEDKRKSNRLSKKR